MCFSHYNILWENESESGMDNTISSVLNDIKKLKTK